MNEERYRRFWLIIVRCVKMWVALMEEHLKDNKESV